MKSPPGYPSFDIECNRLSGAKTTAMNNLCNTQQLTRLLSI